MTLRLIVLVLAIAVAAPLAAEDRMSAGLWELTTTTGGRPPNVHQTCFTAEMVELGNRPAAVLREETAKSVSKRGLCTLKDFKMEGDTISMTETCGEQTIAMKTKYSGSAFETVSTTTGKGARETRIVGRRLGACK